MDKVCLTIDGTSVATFATVPEFEAAPEIVIWDGRYFRFVTWHGDLPRQFKFECPDDVPVYREATSASVDDADTPRSTPEPA